MPKLEERVYDLVVLAEMEGIELPFPAETIAKLEATGATVDLVTGAVKVNGENERVTLTTHGEAIAHLFSKGLL